MSSFSKNSAHQLSTCDSRLRRLFMEVIKIHDCTIIEGYRLPAKQLELYNAVPQRSKVKHGNHNVSPSMAVDVAPYIKGRGIPWPVPGTKEYIKNWMQFAYFNGIVTAKAKELGINIRAGIDWDRDHDLSDQTFTDAVHFEIVHEHCSH